MDPKKRQVLFSNILKLMQTESFPDCRLITQENIEVEAHKIILFQVPYLRNLLTSISCCEGQCGIQEPVTILLPDVSYEHLDPILHYLYTGVLKFPKSEKAVIRDLLLKTFGVPGERVSPTSRPGDVTCDECSDQVHVTKLFHHMMVKHVKEPFLRDIQLAEEGREVEGIGAFDEADAVKSVMDHYSTQLKNILSYLEEEHGIANQLGVDKPELWLEKQRQTQKRKSQDNGPSSSNIATVPENGDNQNKENQSLVENSQVPEEVENHLMSNDHPSPDLSMETNDRGTKRRRKSGTNAIKKPKVSSIADGPSQENSMEVSTNDDTDISQVPDSALSNLASNDKEAGGAKNIKGRRKSNASKTQKISSSTEDPSHDNSTEANATRTKKIMHKTGRDIVQSICQSPRNRSSRLSLKKKDRGSLAPSDNSLKPGKVICQECRAEVSRQTFSKHLVAKHLFKLWTDIKEGETVCRNEECKKVVESSKYLIQHMALTHNELEIKLKEIGKTVADYEWTNGDKDNKEKEPTSSVDNVRENGGGEKANDSGSDSDATMPLGFGEENRMQDFDEN